jgi:hypothetical protein
MNDDQLDEILTETARDYNAPGDVPRDVMWARIAEARQRKAVPPARSRVWLLASAGIAAALLITTGITIGRRLERSSPPGSATVASRDTVTRRDSAPAAATPRQVAAAPRDSVVPTRRDVVREPAGSDRTLAYQLVVLQHLAGTEAMITSFRASAHRGETDAHVSKWARDLLGTTRLLQASPAAEDPVMKRLLEDLELVIVQIVQYTNRSTSDPEELDLIEQSIKKRGVITKLRGTHPGQAGLPGIRG